MDKNKWIETKLDAIRSQIYERAQRENDIGVLSGLSGLSIFLFHYSKFLNQNEVAVEAKELIEICIETLNDPRDFYRVPTFCSGICGFAWSLNYLESNNFLEIELEEYLLQLDTYLYKHMLADLKDKRYDYLHNALGYAFYFLKRYQNTKIENLRLQYKESLFEALKLLDKPSSNSKTENKSVFWESDFMDKNNPSVNLGLAHGIPSILNFYVELYKLESFKDLVKDKIWGIVNYILSYKTNNENSISLFPNYVYLDDNRFNYSRLGWCYGDLGIAFSLWKVSKVLNDKLLKKEAIEIFRFNTKRRLEKDTNVEDMYICHGAFGISHIYDNMYRETGIVDFKECSDYWFKDGLDRFDCLSKELDNQKLSVLEGLSGVGLVLISYMTEEKLLWDECLLLN